MLKPVRISKEHWFYGPVFKAKSIYFQVIISSLQSKKPLLLPLERSNPLLAKAS